MSKRKPVTLIVIGITIIVLATLCVFTVTSNTGGWGGWSNVEDCDADDIKERDPDCGFPIPAKTTKKPATKQTQPSVKKLK